MIYFVSESGGPTLSKIRVLLADDHGEMLERVSELLSSDGCVVVGTASDGQAAIAAAVKLRPDVVVLDISMPILNGIQAAEHMKEADPSIKIVFLTGASPTPTFVAPPWKRARWVTC